MGIPSFYSWLLQEYPNIKIPYTGIILPNKIQCDNLYLDMNQIIHKCAAKSQNEDEISKLVIDHIVDILKMIRPRQLLYMAMDGVTPRARLTHQRANRFLKTKTLSDGMKEKFLTNDRQQVMTMDTFDECNIKPGTIFMSKLSKYLEDFIFNRMNMYKDTWGLLKIIISDANVPGEGEHKIMDFIRRQSFKNTSHVIYGSDSDLILLGLLTHEQHLTILCEECQTCRNIGHNTRDCQKNNSSLSTANNIEAKYVFIDVSELNRFIKNKLHRSDLLFPRQPECSVNDWVFICLLFGNDFLPKSPSIGFFDNNINMNHLIDVYQKNLQDTKGYLTVNGIVNIDHLLKFLKKVSEKDQDGRFLRSSYYAKKFDMMNTQLGTFPIEVATHYVQALCWIFQYYYRGPPSWNWCYPHYYAPLAADFNNIRNVTIYFDQNTKPFRPFEQMMATFPPQNANYLPLKWQSLMLDENSSIIKFYPKNFYVDPNDKKKKSQYVPLLPFIDEKLLLETLQSVYSKLTEEEEKRNRIDYDRLFIHFQNLKNQQFRELIGNDNPVQLQDILNKPLFGYVWLDDNDNNAGTLLTDHENISNNQVIYFKYSIDQTSAIN